MIGKKSNYFKIIPNDINLYDENVSDLHCRIIINDGI